jgi:Zn-dependent M28 family amino/carboxypeptidase
MSRVASSWFLVLVLASASGVTAACGGRQPAPPPASPSFPSLDANAILEHIKVLASDEFEGRAPGTRGEELTVNYLVDRFKTLGLAPGNTDGTYIQKVPLVGITPKNTTPLTFRKGPRRLTLRYRDDVVAWTKRVTEAVAIENSEVVFVGYGVVAPEFDWDDYKGLDAKGKTLVMLVNDPPVPDPANPQELDPKIFGGKAMTYYGRWTYKYEIGAEKGAAAVLIVHETGPAGYPFSVVQNNVKERFDLVTPDKNMGRAAIEGWITLDRARDLFRMAGLDFDQAKRAAARRDFTPIPLGATASMALANTLRTVDSRNVVAKLEGSDPKLRDEYVILTSHWDHLGIGDPVNGDRIYNGAQDNASGTAALLEIARGFTKVQPPPKRTIVFLAVTAEEQGLLGSEYYARMPIYPLEKTLAVINMDAMNLFGRTKDVVVVGLGASDLDDYAREVAAEQGRVITPDPEPEKGFYYRSDHFPFARAGVPALDAGSGIQYIGKPEDYGRKIREEYTAKHYHAPSDEVRPDWDLSGTVEEAEFYLRVAYKVAQADRFPEWKPGNEFRAKREAMLQKARTP